MIRKISPTFLLLICSITLGNPAFAGTCADDTYESQGNDSTDDSCFGASINGSQVRTLCDDDWARFIPMTNATYRIETSNLTGNANTAISLHENCGVSIAANDDFTGLASRVEWTAASDVSLDIHITQFDSVYNGDFGYTLSVECIANCEVPEQIFQNGFESASTLPPDLLVINANASSDALVTAEDFTISATVRNQGDSASDASTLRFYLSADNIIDDTDSELGNVAVSGLFAGADENLEFQATAPGPGNHGSYWVGACVDDVVGEIETNNQCSAGIAINVLQDSDGDRLADVVEIWTGVYVDLNNTGTNPNDADSDDDGMKDGDEVLGTLDGLDLPAMGVSPVRKDVLLEYDWFDDSLCGSAHSHRPTPAAIARVADAFANSPVSNFASADGVNMINDYGQGGVFTGGNLINDPDGVIASGISGAEFKAHKAANFAANRNGYFHYVLLPHRYNTDSGSSGQAERPGDDMIVSLVCSNSTSALANTILHELGHNLNLRHGGNVNCNYKPNYNSVMNYKYQFAGVDNNCTPDGNGVTDLSYGDRITLDESALDELNGTCGAGNPFDWNGVDGFENPVMHNINAYGDELTECGSEFSTLNDYNDWNNLFFGGTADADGLRIIPIEIISEQWVPEEFENQTD